MNDLRRTLAPFLLAAAAWSADAAADDPVPPVFLTHLYVVLDAPTYDALRHSPLVASLAATEETHIDAGTVGWTGFYISGRHTYIELFSARQPPPDGKEGDAGLALTVESPGGVQALADGLRKPFGDRVKISSRRFTVAGGQSVPWFSAVEVEGAKVPPAMGPWVMEIDPGYLAARHPGARIDEPLSRERYQSFKYLPDRPLEDVVAIRCALPAPEMAELQTLLRVAGWRIDPDARGYVARGPDVTLTVARADKRAGIQEIALRLAHPVPKQSVTLGSAQLQLDGLQGHLVFWPRP